MTDVLMGVLLGTLFDWLALGAGPALFGAIIGLGFAIGYSVTS